MMWNGGMGVGDWIMMSLMMIVFWGGLVALIVFAVRAARTERPGPPRPEPKERPDELLAERFARGEIDEDEFTRRREVLHQLR